MATNPQNETANIPHELREAPLWLQWYYSADPKKPDKKPRKHPVVPYATAEARAANLRTLDYLLENRSAVKHNGYQRWIDKTEGFVYIDIDKARDVKTGEVEPWAQTVIDTLDTYTELSASGTGFHLVARGVLHQDYHPAGTKVEIYAGHTANKLLAMTGSVWDLHTSIEDRQPQLDALLHRALAGEFGPAASPKGSVEPLTMVEANAADYRDLPDDALDGWLGQVCRERMAEFPRAGAWLALLVGASVYVPRETKSRCNLYVDIDGPVHAGKSKCFEKAFHLLGLTKPTLMKMKAGSAEGLAEHVGDLGGAPRLLYPDELAHLLEKSMIERSSFARFLTTAFYEDLQEMTVSRRKSLTFNARLTLAGGTVEEQFADLFGSATTGGLYDRFLFGKWPTGFQYDYVPFEDEPPAFTPCPDGELADAERLVPVTIHPAVYEEAKRWKKELGAEHARVIELCLRTAVICASFDGRRSLTANMLGPAYALTKYQVRVRALLRPNPGENPDARISFTIRNWLTEHGPNGEWIKRRDLFNAIHAARLGPGVFDRAIRSMTFNGELEEEKQGRTTVVRLAPNPSAAKKTAATGSTSNGDSSSAATSHAEDKYVD
jgi:hypothetical protein